MFESCWKCLEIAGNGWEGLKMTEIDGNGWPSGNGLKWLEIEIDVQIYLGSAGMDGNGWKQLEITDIKLM